MAKRIDFMSTPMATCPGMTVKKGNSKPKGTAKTTTKKTGRGK